MAFCKNKYGLLEWALFGVIFFSCSPWPFWKDHIVGIILIYVCVVVSLTKMFISNRLKRGKGFFVFFVLLIYFFVFQTVYGVQGAQYSSILVAFSFIVACNITPLEGRNVISLLTNYVFLSIVIPLPLWLIHQFVIPLPEIGTIDVTSWKGGTPGATVYLNHLFFITVDGKEAMRFYSWYDEPGVLGTLAPFVLWSQKFNVRNLKILTIMIGTIFTFSITYIILSFVGIVLCYCTSLKRILLVGLSAIIVGGAVYYVLKDNLAFQLAVIDRIENPEDNGLDHRISYETEKYWIDTNSSLFNQLFGLGNGKVGIAASYKNFLINYGYIGLVLLILAYFSMIGKFKREAFLTLLMFLLSFMQRPNLFTAYNSILYSVIIECLLYRRLIKIEQHD